MKGCHGLGADAIEHQRLRADETSRFLHQICSALDAAHKAGIVHRDLKPENIWIARPAHGESYAKLLDFGIAKLFAGRYPFTSSVTTELAIKHVTEPPPPPARFQPLPAGLERLILDCLAKDPESRPASAAEVLGARIEAELAAWSEHRAAPNALGASAAAPTPQPSLRDERTLSVTARRVGRVRWLLLGLGLDENPLRR